MARQHTVTVFNRTDYSTRDLKKLFTAVLRFFHKKHPTPTRIRVTCRYRKTRDGFCGGFAWFNSEDIVLKLPQLTVGYGGDSFVQRIAKTLLHELDHCRGLTHGDMHFAGNVQDSAYDVSAFENFTIERAVAYDTPKYTMEDKLQRLLDRRKKWQSKAKRATTMIKKIDRQIKYYKGKSE